ncbi:MAG: hypothetical protein ACPGJF_05590 [Sinimarinibacterium flocculans]|uniref:hypothetical protein n=1 Tax=Sinimarinibacterium flocculans TaxID=985250 RepID=UPI003C443F08
MTPMIRRPMPWRETSAFSPFETEISMPERDRRSAIADQALPAQSCDALLDAAACGVGRLTVA